MPNKNKGEVSLTLFEDDADRRRTLTLRFTNGGHREMEGLLGMEQSEIEGRINTGRIGARITTGLLFGATRRYHRRDLPSVFEIDELFDEIDDYADDPVAEGQKIMTHLTAAYTKSQVSDVEARLMGEEPAKNDDAPGLGAPQTKDQDKPARGRKPKPKTAKAEPTKDSGEDS